MRLGFQTILLLAASSCFGQMNLVTGNWVSLGQLPPAAAPSWDPSSASGLQVWFDASALTASEGTAITGWPNRTPGNAGTFATNNNSTSCPFVTNSLNGTTNKALAFGMSGAGTNFFDITNGFYLLSNVPSATLVVIAQPLCAAATRGDFWWCSTPNSLNARSEFAFGGSGAKTIRSYTRVRDGDSSSLVMSPGTVRTNLIELYYSDFAFATGSNTIWTNGVWHNATNLPWSENSSNTPSARVRIGADANTSASALQGWVSELMLYVPALSDTDKLSMSNYWRTRYAGGY
jgi:hypothetical protein